MTLSFPNDCRSYDERREVVRFWGYDSALEVCFFIEASALWKLSPNAGQGEAGCLAAFDAAQERIQQAARKAYSPRGAGAFLLVSEDF